MKTVTFSSYREACSMLGPADTRLPALREWFKDCPDHRVVLCAPVPSDAEILAIEDARLRLAQLHIARSKRNGIGRVRELEEHIAAQAWWMSEHGVEPLTFKGQP